MLIMKAQLGKAPQLTGTFAKPLRNLFREGLAASSLRLGLGSWRKKGKIPYTQHLLIGVRGPTPGFHREVRVYLII